MLSCYDAERIIVDGHFHFSIYFYLLQSDDPMVVIQKLQDFPQRENMYIENAYKKSQNEVMLEDTGMVVDLTTMKIYPKNQPTKQENVVRKEKFKGQSTILDAIAMVDILQNGL